MTRSISVTIMVRLIIITFPHHTFRRSQMGKLSDGDTAPDFSLPNHQGIMIRLSDLVQQKNVMLVFNLGFA